MNGLYVDRTLFFIGFVFSATLPIAEGSKSVYGFQNWGSSNQMASNQDNGGGAFVGAQSYQPSILHY
jgi:hypothetical protein